MPSKLWRLLPLAIAVFIVGGHLFLASHVRVAQHYQVCRSGSQCVIPVVRVIDGDTIVTSGNKRVRFDSFNAPELDEPGGPAARQCVKQKIYEHGGSMTIRAVGIDTYQRTLGRVLEPNLGECFP